MATVPSTPTTLTRLNAALDRFRKVIPADPYVLTIPHDVEPRYHHRSQAHADQWLHQTGFEKGEPESIQYLTWQFYEPASEMYVQQNSWYEREEAQGKKGGATTGPKKKITLGDYKKKLGAGAGTPKVGATTPAVAEPKVTAPVAVKREAIKGPVESAKKEVQEVLEKAGEAEVDEVVKALGEEKKHGELKRRREVTSDAPAAGGPPAAKKARTDCPVKTVDAIPSAKNTSPTKAPLPPNPKENESTASQAQPTRPQTPPPVSSTRKEPALPAKLSPLYYVPALPGRLSPTMPANIAAALLGRKHSRTASGTPGSASKNGKLTPPAKDKDDGGVVKRKSPMARNGFRTNDGSPAVSPDERGRVSSDEGVVKKEVLREPSLSRKDAIAVGQALKERRKLMVILKYGKTNVKRVKMLVAMKSVPESRKRTITSPSVPPATRETEDSDRDDRPAAVRPARTAGKQRDQNAKGVAQKVGANGARKRSEAKDPRPTMHTQSSSDGDGDTVHAKKREKRSRSPETNKGRDEQSTGARATAREPTVKPKYKWEPLEIQKTSDKALTAEKSHAVDGAADANTSDAPGNSGGARKPANGRQADKAQAAGPTVYAHKPSAPAEPVTTVARETSEKRLPAQPANASNAQPAAETKAPAEKQNPALQKATAAKRPAPVDNESTAPSAKRKIPAAIETKRQPSTPAPADLLSPSLLSTAQRSQQVTPGTRKTLLSNASSDSAVNTPHERSSTPQITGQANGTARSVTSQPSNKTPLQQAWETAGTRLEGLGRELKHAAQDHFKSSTLTSNDNSQAASEKKLAAVKLVESLLAYTLAFTCGDEAAAVADPKQSPTISKWRSLTQYESFVKRSCADFPLLVGLTCQLSTVFNAKIMSIGSQHASERPSYNSMLEIFAATDKAAAEAEVLLDMDSSQAVFPKAWAGRQKGVLDDKPEPGKLAGAYKMPIGFAVPPILAARAGAVMLEEWIEKEGLDYRLELGL